MKDVHNNPLIPMRKTGYDVSDAKVKRVNKVLVEDADRVLIIFNKKYLEEIPRYLEKRRDLEQWGIDSISGETTFEAYCKFEEMRIKQIEKRVRDLEARIG